MKILHTADIHLGAYVGPACDNPIDRMANTMKCLDVLVETARQEQPDIILVAGDIFHTAKVWSDRALTEVGVAAKYLRNLSHFAPVVVLYGTPNHDGFSQFDALFEMTRNSYVEYIASPKLININTKSGPIQIAGLPGFDKGHFRAQFPGLSAEEENRLFTEQLSLIVQGLSAQVDSTIPSVLMAHHTVVGCELDNGTHVFQANEVVLDAATLDNSAFDLVCLGHIHKAQRVASCNKPVYYAGSVDAFTFNDEGHEKGFWSHNTDYPYMSELINTPAREFFTARWDDEYVDIYNYNGLTWKLHIADEYRDKIVRVLYSCEADTEKKLDKRKLERDLYAAGAYYVSEIRPEKVTAAVNRDRMHEKLTVSDCLERYLKENGKTELEISQLMFEAIDIIAEAQANSPIGTTSGLFLPVEIEVKNYRSYAEEKLSFEDIFFAMVNGKNGSGKSSLFMDAITDCLYEETREKELTGWIRNGEKSGSISFTFKLGDDLWRVVRTRQRSGGGTLALARFEYAVIDGDNKLEQWGDHAKGLKMPEIQNKIIDLLGMDCDTFQSCVLIMQDRYGKFMEASKEDRMNVLASLLGLGIYDELEKLTKDKLTEVNRTIKALKADIEKLEADVSTEEDLRTEGSQIEVQLAVANDDLKAAREELAGYQVQLVAIEGFVREIAELERDVKTKTDSYTEKKNRKSDLENRVTETESFLQNEQSIMDRCAELDAARLEIAALDGKVQLLNDKRIRHSKINREILTAQQYRANNEKTLETIAESLKDRERLEGIVNGRTVEQDLEACEEKAKQYRELQEKRSKLHSDFTAEEYRSISDITLKNNSLESYIKEAEMLGNSNCIDVDKASCRFLQSAIEAKSKIALLKVEISQMRTDLNSKKAECLEKLKAIDDEIMAIRYDALSHSVLIESAKLYREAKDKLSKLSANAATADALKKQDAETVAKIAEFETELKTLSTEIVELEKGTNCITELNIKVRELSRYEKEKMELPKAKQFVESSREQIRQLITDLAGLTTEIEKGNGRLTGLNEKTTKLSGLKNDICITESEIMHIENQVNMFNQSIGTINAKLEVIVGQKVNLQNKQLELSTSAKQASQLQILSEAFSQDGIPYQIIRDIVPELEAAANEILGQMTGGKMRLEFRMIKVQKSNKNVEVPTLDIKVVGLEALEIDYKSLSGGQKSRVSLAIIFSLSMLKASRVGMQLGFLFMDEPARGLDSEGVEAFCEALETIHNMFEFMKIVVISHDENMKMAFPQQLYVDVTENGSRVRRL